MKNECFFHFWTNFRFFPNLADNFFSNFFRPSTAFTRFMGVGRKFKFLRPPEQMRVVSESAIGSSSLGFLVAGGFI